jgi:hypothetical protein
MSAYDQLQLQADRFRASGLLGKPGALSRLFDFLLTKSLSGEAPKEIEIALQVFAKNTSFDVSQDSVVRVYVHKLRRRLDEFYNRTPFAPGRMVIPKGEYRLTLEPSASPPVEEAEPALLPALAGDAPTAIEPDRSSRRLRSNWTLAAVAAAVVIVAIAIGALTTAYFMGGNDAWELRSARRSSLWAPLLGDDRPITIVVGDYYLMGETDASSSTIRRLVREFYINSHDDFMYHSELNPSGMARYRNLDLSYLPVAAAYALQDIAPILSTKKNVRVVLMSQLDGSILKTSHIVYVGYISGMGMLGDTVFAGSRLSPGGTFDELVDARTQARYVSKAAGTLSGDSRYTDYGYLSTFPGPAGNRIVIISGTRDTGVMHSADAATHATTIDEIHDEAGAASSFESLYEVHGVAKASIGAKRLFASTMKTAHLWDGT